MQTRGRPRAVVGFAAIAIGAGILLGFASWPQPHQTAEFSGLILAAILIATFAMPQSIAEAAGIVPPSFVIDFATLMLLGPSASMLVAAAGTVAQWLTDSPRAYPSRRNLVNAVTVVVAIQAAGFVYLLLGGTLGHFVWPQQGAPIAAAVVAYCFVTRTSAEIVVPFVTRQPLDRSWPKSVLPGCPTYFVAAGLAAAFVEVIDHRTWEILPVAAAPLYFAYLGYCAYVNNLEEDRHRREVIESLDQGMAVVDTGGRITLWNDALEHILNCSSDRAVGLSLAGAVPALGKTELPRAIDDALKNRTPRTLAHLVVRSAAGARILQVRILPVVSGVALLWQDVTERTHAESALKRSGERLALAAEGANDGLWEWDLRNQEFYV